MVIFHTVIASLFFTYLCQASPVISNGGREGVLVFQTTVFMPSAMSENGTNHQKDIGKLIDLQTKHLLGVLEQPQFSKLNKLPLNDGLGSLALGPILNFRVLSEEKSADGLGTEITYVVRHKMLIRKDVMEGNSTRPVKIVLPHDPVEFYSRACTDDHYFEKEFLFYYWSPFKADCKKNLFGKNQVDYVNAQIKTFPEIQNSLA